MRTVDLIPPGSSVDVVLDWEYEDPRVPARHTNVKLRLIDSYGIAIEDRGDIVFYPYSSVRAVLLAGGAK